MPPVGKNCGVNLLVVAILALASASQTAAQDFVYDAWGFGFCAPPPAPPCAKQATSGAALSACQAEVQNYLKSVGAFRLCHLRQLERVINSANDVADLMRCRAEKRSNCKLGQK